MLHLARGGGICLIFRGLTLEKTQCYFIIQRALVFLISITLSGCSTQLETIYLEHQLAELRDELASEQQKLKEVKERSGSDKNSLSTKSNYPKIKKRQERTKPINKSDLVKKGANLH